MVGRCRNYLSVHAVCDICSIIFFLEEYSGIYVNLSLMPIMFGLAISTYTELSFNMTGFLAACANNLLDW